MLWGLNLNFLQRIGEPHHRQLENISGLLPSLKPGKIVEHLPGEEEKPIAGVSNQGVFSGGLTRPANVDDSPERGVATGCMAPHVEGLVAEGGVPLILADDIRFEPEVVCDK